MTEIAENGEEIPVRTVKVSEIVRALELGGYTLGRRHIFDTGDADDQIVDACAVGIMALNLGVDGTHLLAKLHEVDLSNGTTMSAQLIQWVDVDKKPLDGLAKSLLNKTRKVMFQEVTVQVKDYSRFNNYLGKRV